MSIAHAKFDRNDQAKTDFKAHDVLFRMAPGAINPVVRYYVQQVLSKDTYRVQLFDSNGDLMARSIVVTPDRAHQYHHDPVATALMAKIKRYSEDNETII